MKNEISARGLLVAIAITTALENDVPVELMDLVGETPVEEVVAALASLAYRALQVSTDLESLLRHLGLLAAHLEVNGGQ